MSAAPLFHVGHSGPAGRLVASLEDMARKREVHVHFTDYAPVLRGDGQRVGFFIRPSVTPAEAMDLALEQLARAPSQVTAQPQGGAGATGVEIRMAPTDTDGPLHILAIVFDGLTLAEAQTALAHLARPAAPSRPARHRSAR